MDNPTIVIAIPAHNEAEYIADCLTALARQDFPGRFEVVTLLNNCVDDTARVARGLVPDLPYELHVLERWLRPSVANAGVARRMATEFALRRAGESGIVLTTDADSQVAPNWLTANIAAIDAGADAVAGMAVLSAEEEAAIPLRLREAEEKVQQFSTLLDQIDWLLDPDDADPWPRHTEHSGASIAVRAAWLARVGGVPAVALGEDRMLFDRLRRVDARIRHARDVVVTVSARTEGRAKGGMADTIARRLVVPDEWLDDCLETAQSHARRAALRYWARDVWAHQAPVSMLAIAMRLPVETVRRALRAGTFGGGWSELESASPVLTRRVVPVTDLERETDSARAIVESLSAPTRQADTVGVAFAPGLAAVAVPGE